MKKSIYYPFFLALFMSLVLSSCVSNKKFMASENRAAGLQEEYERTQDQLNESNALVALKKEENEALQKDIASIENDLMVLSSESKMTIKDQAERLKSLQDMMQEQTNQIENLRNSISSALVNYNADELNVYQKDGKVYVSLSEKLLFKSGSDVVDPKGKEALTSLATVLNNSDDFTVAIEGHTDDVPIQTTRFKDNWDLSTARASSIVRILTIDNGFDATRITASGRSEFHPLNPNSTKEERAENRRTEIILSPDLQEIYKLLYQ
jgi:chemotaxis protein MotB